MGFFSSKSCTICGEKIGLVSFRLAGNEKICSKCEMLLRGRYDLRKQGNIYYDTLNDVELFQAKWIVDEMKSIQREDILRYGQEYPSVITVWDVFRVSSIGLEEGGTELIALSGKPVAYGCCSYGSFKQGEQVRIIGKNHVTETTVLKLIPCTGAYSFYEELFAKIHETECIANRNAWLVLDCACETIAVHDKIAVCAAT